MFKNLHKFSFNTLKQFLTKFDLTHFPQLYPVKIRFLYKVCYYDIIKDRIISLTVLKLTDVTLGVFSLKMISAQVVEMR